MSTEREPTAPAAAVNPAAGAHLISPDPLARRACEAAIAATYALFPYYQERYAERGRRFSSSDSGWLVTVTDLSTEVGMKQVAWLSRVLAVRGMPRVLLEHHLDHLADALAAVRPEDGPTRCAKLRTWAEQLRGDRLARLSEADTDELTAAFARAAPAEERERLPTTPLMIAGAVADEADGIVGTIDSLVGWLSDRQRFSGA